MLKTTDLLAENGGNDDDNVNDDTMSIEDVRKLWLVIMQKVPKILARHHYLLGQIKRMAKTANPFSYV